MALRARSTCVQTRDRQIISKNSEQSTQSELQVNRIEHEISREPHLPAGQPLCEVDSRERRGGGRQQEGRVRHDVVQPRRPLRRLAVLILEHVQENFFALV